MEDSLLYKCLFLIAISQLKDGGLIEELIVPSFLLGAAKGQLAGTLTLDKWVFKQL